MIVACDKSFHKQCFRCTKCDNVISLKSFSNIEGKPYCKPHYMEIFKTKGTYKAFGDEGSTGSTSFSGGFKGVEQVMTGVKGGSNLKKATTVDKSAPKIDENVSIKKIDRQGFLNEVQEGTQLKEAEEIHDSSAPKIPATVKLADHDQLLKEVEGDHSLHHPDNIHDSSKPVIEEGVHIKKVDRKEILKQGIVENPPKLRDVEEFVNDRSDPHIEEGTTVRKDINSRKVLFQAIKSEEPVPLKKPEARSDRSSPIGVKKAETPLCFKCGKSVYQLEQLSACDKIWHKQCFRCKHCNSVLGLKGFATIDSDPYCKPHYMEIFKTKGTYKAFSNKEGASTSFNPGTFKGVGH
jgi:hypothetical protein